MSLIDSASFEDVFAGQLLPQREMSGVLSLTMVLLVRVEESSLRICRSLPKVKSKISLS